MYSHKPTQPLNQPTCQSDVSPTSALTAFGGQRQAVEWVARKNCPESNAEHECCETLVNTIAALLPLPDTVQEAWAEYFSIEAHAKTLATCGYDMCNAMLTLQGKVEALLYTLPAKTGADYLARIQYLAFIAEWNDTLEGKEVGILAERLIQDEQSLRGLMV